LGGEITGIVVLASACRHGLRAEDNQARSRRSLEQLAHGFE
jgi:hypothetical protein